MIVDLGEGLPVTIPDVDLCVIGSGPAGTTLVAELAGVGLRIACLESGRRRTDAWHDGLRDLRATGIRVKAWSRERVLGGTSTTWSGLAPILDPIDVGPREWLGSHGWPVPYEELMKWWEQAAERYRFPPLHLFGTDGISVIRPRSDWAGDWQNLEEKAFLGSQSPQDFAREQRHAFADEDVVVYLDATVTELVDDGEGVTHAVFRTSAGAQGSVRAKVFVLASGGIENPRLLLVSRSGCPAGLGNEHDQVGRWFLNHPKGAAGLVRLRHPVREMPLYFGCLYIGYRGYVGMRLSDAEQRRRGVLNSYVRFEPIYPWTDNKGVEALVKMMLNNGLLSRLFTQASTRRGGVVSLRDWSETGDDSTIAAVRGRRRRDAATRWRLVLTNLPSVIRYGASRLRRTPPPVRTLRLRNFMEMEPRPDNRVSLADEVDQNGVPLPALHHEITELDRRTMVELHTVLAEELARTGFGDVESDLGRADPWPIVTDSSHHMGGTRMGTDPASSVVDRNLKLHSMPNVYCVGSSVFPTSGSANPTFTIVALAIRLADHLRSEVFGLAPRTEVGLRRAAPAVPNAGATRRGLLVVGAGRRVVEDVLPAAIACRDRWHVEKVFAQSARRLRVTGEDFSVDALDGLRQEDIDAGDLLYLAVTTSAVPVVLERLRRLDLSHIDLMTDTPILSSRHLPLQRHFRAFRSASVAEDSTALPWFDALRDAIGPPTEVEFHRSAYRYHGLAMIKAWLGSTEVRRAHRDGRRIELTLVNGGHGAMTQPRDYRTGWLRAVGPNGVATDDAEADGIEQLRLVVEGDACVGFTCGDAFAPLDEVEQWLFGPARTGESVTSHMYDGKRVGLYRLLRAASEGAPGYTLDNGLDDTTLDWLLQKVGRWRPDLVSVTSPVCRRAVAIAAIPFR